MTVSREDFLRELFRDARGKIEIRAIDVDGKVRSQSYTAEGNGASREECVQRDRAHHLFFGVAARRDPSSGRFENCLDVGAVWADVDFSATPEAEARALVAAFPLPPSIGVRSGYGAHLYWLFLKRLAVIDPRLRPLLAGLAQALHSDPSVVDPARCLRLPGSKNWKYDPAPEVVISSWHPERRYSLEALLAAVPVLEASASNGHPAAAPVAEAIPEGQRHRVLVSVAGSMRRRGLETPEIAVALLEANRRRCQPPMPAAEVEAIAASIGRYPNQPDADTAAQAAVVAAPPRGPEPEPLALLGLGGGAFLAQTFPPIEPYVDGILTSDGSGWIGGEEKSGKTFYATEEALCLALGLEVCGRFTVAQARRVLFIEEEDPPRRMRARLRALLRGHGLDPDELAVRDTLDRQLRVSVWEGVTLDDPGMLARLEATIVSFQPAVVYLDVLRKLTIKDLNKADQAGALLAALDGFRRTYGVLFRILHHYRKQQGFRTGRGSQEIGGSYVLGAWGECSLFFEPVGRTQGAVRVEVQTKDGPPVPGFRLAFQAEGPLHAPTMVRLTAEPESDRQDADDAVLQAVASLPTTEAVDGGQPGVTRAAVAVALKRSEATIRRSLNRLEDAGRLLVTGHATKKAALYAVSDKHAADLAPRHGSADEQRRAGRAYRGTSSSSPSLPVGETRS